jgi:hypothetical protein
MKKAELVAQLEGAKALTSVVSIDNVIALIQQLEAEVKVEKVFSITQDLADDIAKKIERCLDNNSCDLVDTDSVEFELSYDNRIELSRADVNVYEIMEHVTACLEEFVNEEDEEEATEEGVLRDIAE